MFKVTLQKTIAKIKSSKIFNNKYTEYIKKAFNYLNNNGILKIASLPLLILWLEMMLHIFMDSDLKYMPIYTLFSCSAGFVLSAIFILIPHKMTKIISVITSAIISLFYVVEYLAKIILQSYYQPSTLGVAMENNLTDYSRVIWDNIFSNITFIVLAFVPCVLIYFIFKKKSSHRKKVLGITCISLFVVFHLLGFFTTKAYTKGEINPKYLYNTDTNIDDQVEQLGLYTMVRLDIKHIILPPEINTEDVDFSDIAEVQQPEPEKKAEPQIMDIDLEKMSRESTDGTVQYLANYFNNVAPTYKNDYTGMFEGYNVIFFTLEGFSGYAVDKDLTPTLYKLLNEGFVFKNFYSPLHYTSTSNGECQNLLGLYPKNGNPISMRRTGELKTNTYFGLARQLERLGYTNIGYHNNTDMYGRYLSHPNLGYDWRYHYHGLEIDTSSSRRDSFMIEASVEDYINDDKPFNIYYLTITGHTPYYWNGATRPYQEKLKDLKYTERTKAYVATVMEVDKALETLIKNLEKAGKADKTLIVASPDHIPYGDIDILEELSGKKFGNAEVLKAINESNIDFEVYKNSLIIWSASMKEPVEIDKITCQVDVLPTVSNLLGLEYDSRMLTGADALSEREGLVIFSSRSWKTDKGFYNRFKNTFTPARNVKMTESETEKYVEDMKKIVGYKLDATAMIINSNFYDKMLEYTK